MNIWILPVALAVLGLAIVLLLIAAAVNGRGPSYRACGRCQNEHGDGGGACDCGENATATGDETAAEAAISMVRSIGDKL
ncbi:MAG: hypothetical protein JW986_07695 [Methanotrichaceae archaeon]|nr:hypothetical protein [Methanotrichaceae archaeon]